MKKLLSFITAGALLLGSLGLASCSGDLHDNDTQPLFIIGSATGSWDNWDKCTLVEPDGSVQKYEFTATDGEPQFKLSTAGSWATDIAGDDTKEALPVLNGDYVTLHSREAEGLPNTLNVIVKDCTVGEKYTINIKFDAVTLNTSVSVTGSAVVMPVLNLASTTTMKNFPAGKTYTFTRSGTVYTYEFISNADETLSFYIESSTAGLTYGGADLSVANAPLTVYADTEMTTAVKKDHKYKLTVNVPTLTTATITAEEVSMLEKATISANWKYTDNFYEDDGAKSGAVQFFAENTDFEFTVNRVSGDNTLAWGTGTIAVDAEEAKELTYNTDGKAKTVKVTGLKTGTCYKIILTEDKVNFKLSAKVITVPKSDLSKFILAGAFGLGDDVAWGGWFGDSSVAGFPEGFKATATSEADVYAFTFTATDTSHEFAIHEDYNWDVKYCDGVEVKLGNDYVDVKNGGSNAKVTGLTAGKTYKILAKNGYGKITCKVEEVK